MTHHNDENRPRTPHASLSASDRPVAGDNSAPADHSNGKKGGEDTSSADTRGSASTPYISDPSEKEELLAQERKKWKERVMWGSQKQRPARPRKKQGRGATSEKKSGEEEKLPKEKTVRAHEGAPAIRTFSQDVSHIVREQGTSLSEIALAEQRRKHTPDPEVYTVKHPRRSLSLASLGGIIGGVILFAGGVGWLLFAAGGNGTFNPFASSGHPYKGLFVADIQDAIPKEDMASDAELRSEIREMLSRSMEADRFREIVVTERIPATATGTDRQRRIALSDLMDIWAADMPDSLARTLDTSYMLGSYQHSGPRPFLILHVRTEDRALAGMLAWEKSGFIEDIRGIFPLPQTISDIPEAGFTDEIIRERDVRTLNDGEEVLLLYTIPEHNRIIITTHPAALQKIEEKLEEGDG